jgi:hypothetical protein
LFPPVYSFWRLNLFEDIIEEVSSVTCHPSDFDGATWCTEAFGRTSSNLRVPVEYAGKFGRCYGDEWSWIHIYELWNKVTIGC